ncbi:MAG: hypothetical protein RIC35_18875 [Marinoscillum sp.]
MNVRLVVGLGFCLLFNICFSQKSDSVNLRNPFYLKLDISNVVNPIDPGILMGLELKFKEKFSFTQEFGWILSLKDEDNIKQEFTGFKVREEFRVYKGFNDWAGQYYFGVNAFYRYINLRDRVTLGTNCSEKFSWSCDYVRYDVQEITVHQFGGAFKIGLQKNVASNILIEVDVGLGIQNVSRSEFSNPGEMVDYEFNRVYGEDYLGTRSYPTFNAKVGYQIR